MNIGLAIGLIMVSIFIAIASRKRGKSDMKKPERILSFNSKKPVEELMKITLQYAQSNGYKVDDFDEENFVIILSEGTTLTSYGFIYPIYFYVDEDAPDSILIEVGIKSKTPQIGGFETPHQKFFNGIKAAVFAA